MQPRCPSAFLNMVTVVPRSYRSSVLCSATLSVVLQPKNISTNGYSKLCYSRVRSHFIFVRQSIQNLRLHGQGNLIEAFPSLEANWGHPAFPQSHCGLSTPPLQPMAKQRKGSGQGGPCVVQISRGRFFI